MATEKIKFEDLFEEDIFLRAKNSVDLLIQSISLLQQELKKIANELKQQSISFASQSDILALQQIKKELTELVKLQKELHQTKVNLQNQSNKINKQQQKIQQTINQLNKEQEKLLKDIGKQKAKLNLLNTQEYKELIKLKNELKEKNKELKKSIENEELLALAKQLGINTTEQEINAYQDLSEELNKLRKLYKALAAAGLENEPTVQKLKERVNELDTLLKDIDASVGQFQRNVGGYYERLKPHFDNVINSLQGIDDNLAKIISTGDGIRNFLIENFKNFKNEVKQTSGVLKKMRKILGGLGKITLVALIAGIAAIASELKNTVAGAKLFAVEVKSAVETGAVLLRKFAPLLLNIGKIFFDLGKIAYSSLIEPLVLFGKTLKNISTGNFEQMKKDLIEFAQDFKNTLADLTTSMKNAVSEIRKQNINLREIYEAHYKANLKLFNLERKRLDVALKVAELRSKVAKLEEKYNKIIEDDYYRVFERLDKMEKIQLQILERTKEEFKIRKQQLQNEIKYLEQKLEKDKNNINLIDQIKEKRRELIELEDEEFRAYAQINSELRQIYKDRRDFTRELTQEQKKYLIELKKLQAEAFGIPIKSLLAEIQADIDAINLEFEQLIRIAGGSLFESIFIQLRDQIIKLKKEIADQKIREFLQQTRKNFIELVQTLGEDNLNYQIELINISFAEHKKLLNEIIATYKELGKEVPADVQELIDKLDELHEKAIAEARYKDAIEKEKELFEQKQKTIEKQKQLIELENETSKLLINNKYKELNELDKQIIETNKLIQLKQKDNQLLLEKINLLSKEIELEKEKGKFANPQKIKELQTELEILGKTYQKNVLEIEQLNKQQKELFSERNLFYYKQLAKEIGKYTELVTNYVRKMMEQQEKMISENVSSINKRISLLEQLADKNAQNVNESIKQLEEERQKLELERKELEKRKQRVELLLASLDTYAKYIQQGQKPLQALASTIKDITLLRKFVDSLPVYHTGTEFVEAHRNEVIAILEKGERVIPKELNKKLGNISNKELVQKIESMKKEVIEFDYNNLTEKINIALKRKKINKRQRL